MVVRASNHLFMRFWSQAAMFLKKKSRLKYSRADGSGTVSRIHCTSVADRLLAYIYIYIYSLVRFCIVLKKSLKYSRKFQQSTVRWLTQYMSEINITICIEPKLALAKSVKANRWRCAHLIFYHFYLLEGSLWGSKKMPRGFLSIGVELHPHQDG